MMINTASSAAIIREMDAYELEELARQPDGLTPQVFEMIKKQYYQLTKSQLIINEKAKSNHNA